MDEEEEKDGITRREGFSCFFASAKSIYGA
jgi:hypothetical protein